MSRLSTRRLAAAICCVSLLYSHVRAAQKPDTNPNAATIADFTKRVEAYAELQKKLAGKLPKVPKEATPAQLDEHERALGKLIQTARADAKRGDILTLPMQRLIRGLVRQVFESEGGAQLKKEILEEYTGNVQLAVNGRYPDSVPLSTVPPQVLKGLPRLPDEVEYRFVGTSLVILDHTAHLIVDYMERAIP
jgi:hypothetical protein